MDLKDELIYCKPSELYDGIKSLKAGGIDSIDLFVSSKETFRAGEEFLPSDFLEISDSLEGLSRGAGGALLYNGELVHTVFEQFSLEGVIETGAGRVRIVPEQYFAILSKSVDYGAPFIDSDGSPCRDVVDCRLLPRRVGWQDALLDSANALVQGIADVAGLYPGLLFNKLDLFVPPDQMRYFLEGRESRQDSPDAGYPLVLF